MESAYKKAGVPDEYIPYLVAKDALESADGKSGLSSKYHNYGGVKATKNRDSVELDTKEYINGKMQDKKEKFSVFNSADDYAQYMKQLLSNSRYDVFNYDPSQLFNRLVEGGYATDPKYAKKLEAKYKQLYS
jgi:flagellar protein FlgJ